MKTNIKSYFDKKELLGGLLGAPYEIILLNNFLLTYLHQNQFAFCFQKWKHCTELFFLLAKKLKLFILYLPWLLGKKQLNFSFLWYLSHHQNKKNQNKVSNSRNWMKLDTFFKYFWMAFRNTLLEKIVELPNLSGHWLCNFNTLGDKNESVTETNKIAALPPPNPSPPPFLWLSNFVGQILCRVQKCTEKKISLGEHTKRNNLEVLQKFQQNEKSNSPNFSLKNNCTHSNLTFTQ